MKIRSLEVLDAMDALEKKIADVPYTNTTSLITFLESVPVVFQEPTTGVTLYDGTLWGLLHEECWESDSLECAAWMALDATSSDGEGRKHLRKDMVNVAYDTFQRSPMDADECGRKQSVGLRDTALHELRQCKPFA